MNSLEWGPCSAAPPPHVDHGSDRLPALTLPAAPTPNPGGAAYGTTTGNATAGIPEGPQAPASAAPQANTGTGTNDGAVVPSQGKKRRWRTPRVEQRQEELLLPLPPSTTTAAMTISPHLVDWCSASLRQWAEYYIQGVHLLAEKNALDLRRVAMTKYVKTDESRGRV